MKIRMIGRQMLRMRSRCLSKLMIRKMKLRLTNSQNLRPNLDMRGPNQGTHEILEPIKLILELIKLIGTHEIHERIKIHEGIKIHECNKIHECDKILEPTKIQECIKTHDNRILRITRKRNPNSIVSISDTPSKLWTSACASQLAYLMIIFYAD